MATTTRKRLPMIIAGAVAIALLAGGTVWWINKQNWEKTDNAFVEADSVMIAPRISGQVVEVLVHDNQQVQAGQIVARLDDADALSALAEAEANLASLNAAVGQVDAQLEQQQAAIAARAASVDQSRTQANLAQKEVDRYGRLAQQGWVSSQRMDTQRAQADTARASVAQAQAALTAEQRTLGVLSSNREQSSAAVQKAQAAVDQAKLTVERTVIRAPIAGTIGARSVRVGQVVAAGSQLMSVVPTADTYVVANFKETQIGRMRLGQRVEIKADAFPDQKITGRIDSFSPATGAEFALIPVENATGNFTKVTQRVPVRISIDDAASQNLRAGLSVHVAVDLKTAPEAAK